MKYWCILRMAGPRTLRVADSLAAAGFEVWTPIEVRSKRSGPQRARSEVRIPVAATYVFADAARLNELRAISEAPVSDHPDFSVFRHGGGYPLIADANLRGFRKHEARKAAEYADLLEAERQQRRPTFADGTIVRTDGAFAGMDGVVIETEGKFVLVGFGGWALPVKIDPWQLTPMTVEGHDIAA